MPGEAAVVGEHLAETNRKGNAVISLDGLLKLSEPLAQLLQPPGCGGFFCRTCSASGNEDQVPAFHIYCFA
ncbi:hypothetical protein D3C71_2107680 [compost metagenome]